MSKSQRETWYVLEDGSFADPNDVAPDEAGHLVHADGVRVRLSGDVYASRSLSAAERAAAVKARAPKDPPKDPPKDSSKSGKAS